MAKIIELRAKQSSEDKYNKAEYKKGKVYSFNEKRAEELLQNQYLFEKVNEIEVEEKTKDEKQEKAKK